MTNDPSSEQWNVTGNAERNVYQGNQSPVIKNNQGLVNIIYGVTPLPEAMGVPNNIRRSGTVTFVGREDMLGELHERLQANEHLAIVSIRGMGGIGKTELALQYSLYYGHTYTGGLCWLRARENVGVQIIAFARAQLDLTPPMDLDLSDQVAYCWRHWRAGEVLLIFDDMQQYSDIEPFLPPSEHRFKALLTTRKHLGGAFSELMLGTLARSESLAFLKVLVTDGRIEADLDQADWLCDWLGDLPLGLELVGRYLALKSTVTLIVLRDRLERKRLEARALENAYPGMTATAGVAAAFEVSWELLGAGAQRLAKLLSLFALAPIPWQLVQDCWSDADMEDLEDWRDDLVALHLLKQLDSTGDQSYQLHQLLREFFGGKLHEITDTKGPINRSLQKLFGITSKEMADARDLTKRVCQVMVTVSQQLPETPTLKDIRVIAPAIPHVAEMATTLKDSLNNRDLMYPFVALARFYEGQGLYNDAEPWNKKCLVITRDRLGHNHPSVASSINNLAGLYKDQGRYIEAEPLFQDALAMRKRLLGNEHPDVAISLNNLAGLYKDQGRYIEAEPLYQNALVMQKQLLSDEHPDVAISLNNLAGLYKDQGRYTEAESLFQDALAMRKRLLDDEHISVAQSLNNLAGLYKDQGRYTEAETLYQNALAMWKQLLGDEHPDVAYGLNNLAVLYKLQERYTDAEPLFQDALAMRKRLLDDEHPSVAESLNNLAGLYKDQGRYTEAETLYQNALMIWKQLLGDGHPNVAHGLNNLASLYEKQKRYTKAEPLLQSALAMYKRLLGNEHPSVAISLNNLASLYEKQKRYTKAKSLYQDALLLLERHLGLAHPFTNRARENLQRLQNRQNS